MFRYQLLAAALAALCYAIQYKELPGFVDMNAYDVNKGLCTTFFQPPQVCGATGGICQVYQEEGFYTNYWPDAVAFDWEAQYAFLEDPNGCSAVNDYNTWNFQVRLYCGGLEGDQYMIDDFFIPWWKCNTTQGQMFSRKGTIQEFHCDQPPVLVMLGVYSASPEAWWADAELWASVKFRYPVISA